MMRYFKLVNFELGRFFKLYGVIIGITILSQLVGLWVVSNSYMERANYAMFEENLSPAQFVSDNGEMSLLVLTRTLWFLGPIALGAIALLFNIFFVWYRDWFGKNTFIYRLLMLPTARINVYLAKATSILLMVLGLVAIQIVLLPVESVLLKWLVTRDFRLDLAPAEVVSGLRELMIILPAGIIDFVLVYGAGIMVVFILFTAILFERSYRIKGIVFGAIYAALATGIFLFPLILEGIIGTNYLYPMELLILEIILGLIVSAASIWVANYLLTKRITV
ncbi:hypothetical protein BN988_02517 [Oceanobacillus picturae]|uniref:ABC-2 family transporter protein n=1 Tax=Oceanobacillus picturae TaxID=171693 RepID=W9AMV6_9BACI|nr:hypothetical protein [Oceanobacillus picturae]RIU91905.1 hypothetical protein D1864_09775 [Oceanobacillus picturae]CDO03981.1 hypothetical protein BN988_02517 [Oceanobacillus picturae]